MPQRVGQAVGQRRTVAKRGRKQHGGNEQTMQARSVMHLTCDVFDICDICDICGICDTSDMYNIYGMYDICDIYMS